jgi:hypothetical protein
MTRHCGGEVSTGIIDYFQENKGGIIAVVLLLILLFLIFYFKIILPADSITNHTISK